MTRPEGQAAGLLAGIRALGAQAEHIPWLAIEPIADTALLESIAHRLSDYVACIFISANAVRLAWPVLGQEGWPQNTMAACIGPGTAAALRERGVTRIVMPESRYDSEGLLAEEVFARQCCDGQAFALIRGEGGRDLLAQSLRARGARVDEVAVYRRTRHPDALSRLQGWIAKGGGVMLISSSESLQQVLSVAPGPLQQALKQQPVLVPHPRIAEVARQSGFDNVTVTAGGDDGMLEALRSYNAQSA